MRGNIRRAFLSVAVVAFTLGSALLASAATTPPKGPPSGGAATDVTCTGCVGTTDLEAGAVTDDKVTDGRKEDPGGGKADVPDVPGCLRALEVTG